MCVLIVEDEPLILMCVAFAVEDAGLEVLTAAHGAEAIGERYQANDAARRDAARLRLRA